MGKKTKDKEDMGATGDDKQRKKVTEAIAKHLRFNVTIKSATIKGRKIEYFPGAKAVDCLMASKWTKKPSDLDSHVPYFSSRQIATDFCTQLLRQQFFLRLKKVEVVPKSDPASVVGEEKEGEGLRKRKDKPTDSPRMKKTDDGDADGEKKRKRKFRLEVHEQQIFSDSLEEVYYWEYDPPSRGTYIIGFAILIGAAALTLQPLWPESTRVGVWYASMGLLGVMGCLVVLIIARWFLFGLVQVFTVGKLFFWVLPNLDNEKCGFFESFQPLYSIEWKKTKSKKSKKSSEQSGQRVEGHTAEAVEDESKTRVSEDS